MMVTLDDILIELRRKRIDLLVGIWRSDCYRYVCLRFLLLENTYLAYNSNIIVAFKSVANLFLNASR